MSFEALQANVTRGRVDGSRRTNPTMIIAILIGLRDLLLMLSLTPIA